MIKSISKTICILMLLNLQVFAAGDSAPPPPPPPPPPPGVQGADSIVEEDPFLDYSDFEADPQQERDEQFFRHGRYFMLSLQAGYTHWSSNLGTLYSSAPLNTFGGKLTYFFDLNWAMDLGFYSSKHDFAIFDENAVDNIGLVDVRFSRLTALIKYYFSQRNLPSMLVNLNPSVGVGAGSFYRRRIYVDLSNATDSESSVGFVGQLGLEYPIRDKSTYFTADFRYSFVNYPDETSDVLAPYGYPMIDGDPYEVIFGLTLCW